MVGPYLRFDDGAVQFRQRLVVAILSHRPILIRNIRSNDIESPGLRDYEASFLRLLDKLTNGTTIEINSTGTQLRLKPGILLGGDHEHNCFPEDDDDDDAVVATPNNRRRGVSWFIEGILPLALFGKEPLTLKLFGITDGLSNVDPSVDYISMSFLPLMRRFIIHHLDDMPPPSIQVLRRGAFPKGGGEVHFYCPIVQSELVPLDFTDFGKIKRVRGVAISCRISPSSTARVAYSAKGVLHRLLPDVWIHTDTHTGSAKSPSNNNNKTTTTTGGCGPSPGLSLLLVAESTTGVGLCAECSIDITQTNNNHRELPEDLGQRGAAMLLEEIRKGGCVDTTAQSFALILMCLGPEDVARIRLGTLSQYTIASLRLFKEAFGVEFKIKADHETKTVVLSCLGTGYRNMARAST